MNFIDNLCSFLWWCLIGAIVAAYVECQSWSWFRRYQLPYWEITDM